MVWAAGEGDVQELLQMGKKFHRMAALPCRYDELAFANTLRGLMAGQDTTVLRSERGMIGGAMVPAFIDPDWKIAIELFFWSEDGHGMRLMRAFEKWATDMGASEIRMSAESSLPRAAKIYALRGYKKTEESWSKC